MKNKQSKYLIVCICLIVGLLHFLIGPNYQGIFKKFIGGYVIDIILPLNLYLLLQIGLRDYLTVNKSRIIAAIFTFSFGVIVELFQLNKIPLFGTTYDSLDVLMYGIGVGLGLLLDFTIITRLEKKKN
ncbi:MAG: hypothetical protein ACK4M1_01165 [Flavobacterium sp.]